MEFCNCTVVGFPAFLRSAKTRYSTRTLCFSLTAIWMDINPYKLSCNTDTLWRRKATKSRAAVDISRYIGDNFGLSKHNFTVLEITDYLSSRLLLRQPFNSNAQLQMPYTLDTQEDRALTAQTPTYLAMSLSHFLHSAIRMQDIHNFLCISRASFITVETFSSYLHEDIVLHC